MASKVKQGSSGINQRSIHIEIVYGYHIGYKNPDQSKMHCWVKDHARAIPGHTEVNMLRYTILYLDCILRRPSQKSLGGTLPPFPLSACYATAALLTSNLTINRVPHIPQHEPQIIRSKKIINTIQPGYPYTLPHIRILQGCIQTSFTNTPQKR